MRPSLIRLALCLMLAHAAPAGAQGLFSPVAQVGDAVVTGYEVSQRALFNRLLGTPGDVAALSLEQLIDDRLRLSEAERLGIAVAPAQIEEGMAEFAGRANLETPEFVAILARAGIDEATFRDFVEAGVAWREVVRARFGAQSEVSERAIDRAIADGEAPGAGPRFLLSEIIIPAATAAERSAALARARQIAAVQGEEAFARAARAYSAAGSAPRGGRLNWLPADALPAGVGAAVSALSPGEVSAPVSVPGAVAVFYLREAAAGSDGREGGVIDYAAFYIPGGRGPEALSEAARLRARVDTCEDLYPAVRGLPAERLERGELPRGRIPADIAAELDLMDANEVSTRLTRANGQTLVFLMLCAREGAVDPETVDRRAVAAQLRNARLAGLADGYLDELRAETPIVRP